MCVIESCCGVPSRAAVIALGFFQTIVVTGSLVLLGLFVSWTESGGKGYFWSFDEDFEQDRKWGKSLEPYAYALMGILTIYLVCVALMLIGAIKTAVGLLVPYLFGTVLKTALDLLVGIPLLAQVMFHWAEPTPDDIFLESKQAWEDMKTLIHTFSYSVGGIALGFALFDGCSVLLVFSLVQIIRVRKEGRLVEPEESESHRRGYLRGGRGYEEPEREIHYRDYSHDNQGFVRPESDTRHRIQFEGRLGYEDPQPDYD